MLWRGLECITTISMWQPVLCASSAACTPITSGSNEWNTLNLLTSGSTGTCDGKASWLSRRACSCVRSLLQGYTRTEMIPAGRVQVSPAGRVQLPPGCSPTPLAPPAALHPAGRLHADLRNLIGGPTHSKVATTGDGGRRHRRRQPPRRRQPSRLCHCPQPARWPCCWLWQWRPAPGQRPRGCRRLWPA